MSKSNPSSVHFDLNEQKNVKLLLLLIYHQASIHLVFAKVYDNVHYATKEEKKYTYILEKSDLTVFLWVISVIP